MTTAAPSAARRLATAAPIPLLPPVTTAALPTKRPVSLAVMEVILSVLHGAVAVSVQRRSRTGELHMAR